MLKFIISFLVLLPSFAWAAKDLECSRDDRFRDGNMVELKLKTDASGLVSAYLSTASSGRVFPGSPAPVAVTDPLVASGMRCIASKLDERILNCANESWSETVSSTLVARSVLEALGPGNVTHKMVEKFEVALQSSTGSQTYTFSPGNCVVK